MNRYEYTMKRWPLLALAAVAAIALLLQSCSVAKHFAQPPLQIALPAMEVPKVVTKSLDRELRLEDIEALCVGQSVSVVDTASSMTLLLECLGDNRLRLSSFSFQPKPFELQPIKVDFDPIQEQSQPANDYTKLILIFGLLAILAFKSRN